jgi:hypothetical protein
METLELGLVPEERVLNVDWDSFKLALDGWRLVFIQAE